MLDDLIPLEIAIAELDAKVSLLDESDDDNKLEETNGVELGPPELELDVDD